MDSDDDNSVYADDGREQDFTAFSDAPLTACTRDLNLSTQYVKNWTGRHAFREFLQNQLDGMAESYEINPRELKVEKVRDDVARRIEVSFLHPATSELCGWIIFTWDDNDEGILEMVNCNARLFDENFDFGGTSKANKSNQAGKHGEGFKVAALVLCRDPQNYSVRITTASSYINMSLTLMKKLKAKCSQMTPSAIHRIQNQLRQQESDGRRRVKLADPRKDVKVEIGIPRVRKALDGTDTRTSKIRLADFEDWLNVTPLINAPNDFIRTDHGDLIFDEAFNGRFFLRDLELPGSSVSGKALRFGYNLAQGSIGRDRTSLSNANEEAKLMAKIWSEAIEQAAGTDREQRMLDTYAGMIEDNEAADVQKAKDYLSRGAVTRLWARLLHNAGSQQPSGFFYCPDFADDDVQIIKDYLGQTPMPLTRNTWELLRKYELCKSAQEERHQQFQGLPAIDIDRLDEFGRRLLSLLKACLLAHPQTANKEVVLVDGGSLNILTYYDADLSLWKVEKKLFDFDTCHEGVFFCEAEDNSNDDNDSLADAVDEDIFWCHHAVLDTYHNMVKDLGKDVLGMPTELAAEALLKRLSSMVRHMTSRVPQKVTISSTDRIGQLRVTWDSSAASVALKHSKSSWAIALHRVGECLDLGMHLLYNAGAALPCRCTEITVSFNSKTHVIDDVELGHLYFATVRCNDNVAIYATSNIDTAPRAIAQVIDLEDEGSNDVQAGITALTRREPGMFAQTTLDGMDLDDSSNDSSDRDTSADSSSSTDTDTDTDVTASSAARRLATGYSRSRTTNNTLASRSSIPSRSRTCPRPILRTNRQSSADRGVTLQDVLAQTDAMASDNITHGQIARRDWHRGRPNSAFDGVFVAVPKTRGTVAGSSSDETGSEGRAARRVRFSSPQ